MAETDPAKELADTLAILAAAPSQSLTDRISKSAKVEPWSSEFFRIVFEIINRADLVASKVDELSIDDDIKSEALKSIGSIKQVFTNANLLSRTTDQVRPILTGGNGAVLKMLSINVRQQVSYPLLNEESRSEILEEVTQLREWLTSQQTQEKDFIRQSLIDGLDGFIFRLERLEWLGHGYALEGLKNVIEAYLSLQGARVADNNGAELQDAILAKTQACVGRVLGIFDIAKTGTERADWALKAYGAVSALVDGSETVVGLLK